jgi:hypothetical protein
LTAKAVYLAAFVEAIKVELEQYAGVLQYISEYQLTMKPLQIDVVIIKKPKEVVITKNIGAIFKAENLVEYKSPEDYVSVWDFYKVYGYACFYASKNEVPITDLTLTFVESRYPRDLIAHLEAVKNYTVEETQPGIYTVSGDTIPIQIINSAQLSEKENLWLKDLSGSLDIAGVLKISAEVERRGKTADLAAYFDVIGRANWQTIKEAIKMGDIAEHPLVRVFEEVGWAAKWEARGRAEGEARGEARGEAKGREKDIQNLLEFGMTPEQVSTALKIPLIQVIAAQGQA